MKNENAIRIRVCLKSHGNDTPDINGDVTLTVTGRKNPRLVFHHEGIPDALRPQLEEVFTDLWRRGQLSLRKTKW